ncbi:MAG TPA: hypothetical protein VMB27_11745 [Solirubrobacteraceae bacterium]|nr:hypothetical protein [Solirubrobacteraceae bacterium]
MEHDAVDRSLEERAADARDGVTNEHVGVPADPPAEPVAERGSLVCGCIYYEQP